jgi:hypothetical protein
VDGLPDVSHPTGLRGSFRIPLTGPFGGGTWVFDGVCLLLAAASLFLRYRRSAGEERLQLKWFAYVAVLSLGLLVALLPLASTSKERGRGVRRHHNRRYRAGGPGGHRHRHLEVPALRDRPDHLPDLSYGLVTGAVAGVYLGCIAVLTKLLPVRGSLGIAVAVLAAVALFNPLRRRVQTLVDQRFDRARYNAERVVAQFSVQLRDEVDLDVLGADLLDVVHHVLAPAHLGLWLNGTVSPSSAPEARAADVTVAQSIALSDHSEPGRART